MPLLKSSGLAMSITIFPLRSSGFADLNALTEPEPEVAFTSSSPKEAVSAKVPSFILLFKDSQVPKPGFPYLSASVLDLASAEEGLVVENETGTISDIPF